VHHVRFFLAYDEVASLVLGQAGLHRGQDLGVLAIGIISTFFEIFSLFK